MVSIKRFRYCALLVFLLFLAVPLLARGDKVIPQVADGPGIRTKFDLVNISGTQAINNFELDFYQADGSPWMLSTTLGTGIKFTLSLVPRQTLRVETNGISSSPAGYAVIRDNEPSNSQYSIDFVLGISVYYEISTGAGVVDTVSVPVNQPTGAGAFPVEMNLPNVSTGAAIVNWLNGQNNVYINLYSQDGSAGRTQTLTLQTGQHRAEFLDQNLFPGLNTFKGMAEFTSDGPIAILVLLQTQTASGVRYATLAATDKEALRSNTDMLVPQMVNPASMPIDFDGLVVDYFQNSDGVEAYSWDLTYDYQNQTTRFLTTHNGAGVVALPNQPYTNADSFDGFPLTTLKSLTYGSDIDLSDSSGNFSPGFGFAVHTDLGNYVKARIVNIYYYQDSQGNIYYDLALEVYVYK